MDNNIEITPFYFGDPDLEQIGLLYCKTFLEKDPSFEDNKNAIINIKKHANYQGFRGLKAKDSNGNIIGFGYGYTSLTGQFYRQKIAEHLSEKEINHWLNNCFEFVELAVNPSYKRLGIASKLHDILLAKSIHKTAILTAAIENIPAINLYTKKGWEIVKRDVPVISDENLQVIMGKEIDP